MGAAIKVTQDVTASRKSATKIQQMNDFNLKNSGKLLYSCDIIFNCGSIKPVCSLFIVVEMGKMAKGQKTFSQEPKCSG